MTIRLPNARPLLGAAPKLRGVKLKLGVIEPEGMELSEQKRVETLLKMPRILLVDDDSSYHEHRTSAVCSRLIDEAQVQQALQRVRAPPKRGTFCMSAEEQAHGTE